MERHTDTKKLPETIKVPLQSVTKTGKTIFAYMRRSTTKKEQASSLPQQEEGIEYIAKNLGMEISSIRSYVESRSGFENRSRKEWQKMLEEIDKQNEPCIILCRDTSRLSRNPTDNLAIANRMFGDNKQKKVIQSIYFLGTGMIVDEWNEKTNKKHIVDTLHQNYTDSMENKEKCIAGVLLKLEQGEFPYCPPHGLSRVNRDGMKRASRNEKTTLKQNEKMPFVRQAFEMKAKGRTAKEICKYLKQYGGVHISGKNIVETIIANTVYMGVYTEKTTGSVFENIKFWEGKPPIDKDLWERANAKVGKKGSGFGQLQSEHIAPGILKHESGKNLYLYKAKGKYNAYQTEVKGENGERKSIGMMESQIVKKFLDDVIPRIQEMYFKISRSSYRQLIKGYERDDHTLNLKFEEIGRFSVVIDNNNDDEWSDEGLKIDLCGGFYDIIELSGENLLTQNGYFKLMQGESNGYVSFIEASENNGANTIKLWGDFYTELLECFVIYYDISRNLSSRDDIACEILDQMDKEFQSGRNIDKTMEEFNKSMKLMEDEARKEYQTHRSPKFQESYTRCISLLVEVLKTVGVDISPIVLRIYEKEMNVEQTTHAIIKSLFENSPGLSEARNEAEIREQQKKELEEKKKALEEERDNIDTKAFKLGYDAGVASKMKKETEKEIYDVQTQLDLLSESTNIEDYLNRLPEIVRNLHELASRVLPEADYEGVRDDIRQLIEIVSHELILTNKKELQIRLFDVLEELEIDEMGNGAQVTAHTRTAIRRFVDNYDRIKEKNTKGFE